MKIALTFALAAVACTAATATTLFVCPPALGGAQGSHAYETLHDAQAAARALRADTMMGNTTTTTIELCAGRHPHPRAPRSHLRNLT